MSVVEADTTLVVASAWLIEIMKHPSFCQAEKCHLSSHKLLGTQGVVFVMVHFASAELESN